MNYKDKYLKYKLKYLNLKKKHQTGGNAIQKFEDFIKNTNSIERLKHLLVQFNNNSPEIIIPEKSTCWNNLEKWTVKTINSEEHCSKLPDKVDWKVTPFCHNYRYRMCTWTSCIPYKANDQISSTEKKDLQIKINSRIDELANKLINELKEDLTYKKLEDSTKKLNKEYYNIINNKLNQLNNTYDAMIPVLYNDPYCQKNCTQYQYWWKVQMLQDLNKDDVKQFINKLIEKSHNNICVTIILLKKILEQM